MNSPGAQRAVELAPSSLVARRQPHMAWVVRLRMEAVVAGAGAAQLPPAVLRSLVVATPTASHRHDLVKAMRAWRRVRNVHMLACGSHAGCAAAWTSQILRQHLRMLPTHPITMPAAAFCLISAGHAHAGADQCHGGGACSRAGRGAEAQRALAARG